MDTKQKLILNRGLLFAFAFTGLVWGYVNIVLIHHIITLDPLKPGHPAMITTSGQFFMYATIWSNIFCFIWSVLGLTALIQANKKLEKIINHWVFKAAPVMWISVTFIVLNFVLIPESMAVNGVKWTLELYLGISIFQHVLVPIFMVNDFRLTKGFSKKTKYSWKKIISNSFLALIPAAIWICLSIILLWQGLIKPQYFFMKLFAESKKTIIINSIILGSVVVFFFAGNMGLFLYHNKNSIEKNNKIQKKKIIKG